MRPHILSLNEPSQPLHAPRLHPSRLDRSPCPLLLDHGLAPSLILSNNVAQRFRLANKGGLTFGHDADFSLVTQTAHTFTPAGSLTRHPISPYLRRQRITDQTRGTSSAPPLTTGPTDY